MLNEISSPLAQLVAGSTFVVLLLVACVTDLRARRIPNVLVVVIAVAGVVFSLYARPWPSAMSHSVGGLATGFAVWFPLYLARMIGAGDVKFFAAASVWLGPAASLDAALLSALVGGGLSVIWLLRRGALDALMLRRSESRSSAAHLPDDGVPPLPNVRTRDFLRVPYGIAMAAGLAIAAFFPGRTLV